MNPTCTCPLPGPTSLQCIGDKGLQKSGPVKTCGVQPWLREAAEGLPAPMLWWSLVTAKLPWAVVSQWQTPLSAFPMGLVCRGLRGLPYWETRPLTPKDSCSSLEGPLTTPFANVVFEICPSWNLAREAAIWAGFCPHCSWKPGSSQRRRQVVLVPRLAATLNIGRGVGRCWAQSRDLGKTPLLVWHSSPDERPGSAPAPPPQHPALTWSLMTHSKQTDLWARHGKVSSWTPCSWPKALNSRDPFERDFQQRAPRDMCRAGWAGETWRDLPSRPGLTASPVWAEG